MNSPTTSDVQLFPWTTMFSVPPEQIDLSGEGPVLKVVNPQATIATFTTTHSFEKHETHKKTQKVASKTL